MDGKPLEVDFKLSDTKRTLTPLAIPDYNEISSGISQNKDYIAFEINIKNTPVNTLIVKISQGVKIIYQEVLDTTKHSIGKHTWNWDGFNNLGIFNTKELKQSALVVELTASSGSQKKIKSLTIKSIYAEQDWVDAQINKNNNQIDIELRTEIKDGESNGVGELPPEEVQKAPAFKHYPGNDPRRKKHIRQKNFNDLKALLLLYIKSHWSRKITTSTGLIYNVNVNPIASKNKAMDDISIVYNTNREWLRSSNPGSIRGFYSLFGNFVPERIVYNIGWIKYQNGWGFMRSINADKSFGETAAHELGHEILSAYGGDSYSYGHKGSSTIVSQTTKKVSDGGVTYPGSGEIDLMKYYNGSRPANFYSRVYASEQDVKSLLWLAKLNFS